MKHCYFLKFEVIAASTMQVTSTAYYAVVSETKDDVHDESNRIISAWTDSNTLPVFKGVLSTAEMLLELENLMVNIKLNHLGLCFQFFFS